MGTSWSTAEIQSHYQYRRSKLGDQNGTIVLTHGLGLDMTTWDFMWDRLLDTYNLLRFNAPGHGGRKYSSTVSFEGLAGDLHDLLEQLRIYDVHILGHGMGANVGLLFAARHPQTVLTLTSIAAHLYVPRSIFDDMIRYRRELAVDETLKRVSRVMVPRICMDPEGQTGRILCDAYEKVSPSTYFSILSRENIVHYNDVVRSNTQAGLPILQVCGEHDAVSPPYTYGISTSMFRNSRFIVLPDASNAVHLDDPETVARLTTDFIQRHKHNVHSAHHFSALHVLAMSDLLDKPDQKDELYVDLLGRFHVTMNDTPVVGDWNHRRARSLLTYLVFHPHVTRDKLCEEFWPDYDPTLAKGNLRVCLHHLKTLLGLNQGFLKIERDSVSLEGNVHCDLIDALYVLQSIAVESLPEKKVAMIEQLMTMIAPDSLDIYGEAWFLEIRSRMELQVTTAAKWLGEHHLALGHYLAALSAWEYCLSFDDYDIPVYDRIVEVTTLLNRPADRKAWESRKNTKLGELG